MTETNAVGNDDSFVNEVIYRACLLMCTEYKFPRKNWIKLGLPSTNVTQRQVKYWDRSTNLRLQIRLQTDGQPRQNGRECWLYIQVDSAHLRQLSNDLMSSGRQINHRKKWIPNSRIFLFLNVIYFHLSIKCSLQL